MISSGKQWTPSDMQALCERILALPESSQRWIIEQIRVELHQTALRALLSAKGGGS